MPETFDADWLALREPADHRARAAAAIPLLAAAWRRNGWSRVVDLGSGAGSNLRYLAPRLPGPQHWTLVDHDRALLARAAAPGAIPEEVTERTVVAADLAGRGLDAIADAGAQLATGSALLDLVSAAWLQRLVAACRQAGCAACFALNYDGGIQWRTADGGGGVASGREEADDAALRRAVKAHQRRDKGFGPALGPMAGLAAESAFRAAGYRVWLLRSPWRLGPDDAALARALVAGWEAAAIECAAAGGPDAPAPARVRAWAARRRATIDGGAFDLSVGHVDLLALPPETKTGPGRA